MRMWNASKQDNDIVQVVDLIECSSVSKKKCHQNHWVWLATAWSKRGTAKYRPGELLLIICILCACQKSWFLTRLHSSAFRNMMILLCSCWFQIRDDAAKLQKKQISMKRFQPLKKWNETIFRQECFCWHIHVFRQYSRSMLKYVRKWRCLTVT